MLEETDRIDMEAKGEDGKIMLVITDSGMTSDPKERISLFFEKLKTYVAYVMSGDFKKEHPGLTTKDVKILVMCRIPPTEQMAKITQVSPSGIPEKAIPVLFHEFRGSGD